jgi:predicted nuclease of predicted toxin-antitoxin system
MLVKLDEDLSESLGKSVARHGHLVSTVRGQGWGGIKDPDLWPPVCAEKACLVTADKAFGDIPRFPPGTHQGILLLRADRESLIEYKALLEMVMQAHPLESLVGSITVASPRGIRIRRE